MSYYGRGNQQFALGAPLDTPLNSGHILPFICDTYFHLIEEINYNFNYYSTISPCQEKLGIVLSFYARQICPVYADIFFVYLG